MASLWKAVTTVHANALGTTGKCFAALGNCAVPRRIKPQRLAGANALAFAATDAVGTVEIDSHRATGFGQAQRAGRADRRADAMQIAGGGIDMDRRHERGGKPLVASDPFQGRKLTPPGDRIDKPATEYNLLAFFGAVRLGCGDDNATQEIAAVRDEVRPKGGNRQGRRSRQR